jgi:hypothetical protein
MPTLEAQLTALTQEFVARLVDAIRNASFAEVANLSLPRGGAPREARGPKRIAQAPTSNGRGEAGRRRPSVPSWVSAS